MKKLVLSLCLLFAIASSGMAGSFTLAVSTYLPTIADPAATWPSLDGNASIGNIILTNSGATAQTVTFYELSESSLTAVIIGYAVIPTTGTEIVSFEGEIYEDLGIIKSATGTTVTATVFFE